MYRFLRQEGKRFFLGFEAVGDCFEERKCKELIPVTTFYEITINIMVGEKHSYLYSDCCNWQLVDDDNNVIYDWTVDWEDIQYYKNRYNGLDENEKDALMAIESNKKYVIDIFLFSIRMRNECKNMDIYDFLNKKY